MSTQDQPMSPLVAEVMTAMMSQTHAATNAVIDDLTAQLSDSHATVDAIRARIRALMDGPYMPTPDAILAALYPSAEEREMFREAAG